MTLDLLINQVLEKDAACFLHCETQSIEARGAKTWGGWIPTSNCWQHTELRSQNIESLKLSNGLEVQLGWHWHNQICSLSGRIFTYIEQRVLYPYWQIYDVSLCLTSLKYPAASLNAPQLAQRPLSHKPLLLPARFRSTTFSKSSRLASHPRSLACPVLSLKRGEYLEGSGCTQVARAD